MKTRESERILLLTISLTFVVIGLAYSQANQFVSNRQVVRENTDSVDKNAHKTGLSNQHAIPLFGERPRSAFQKKEDERFLQSCDRLFPNRQEACAFFSERAWDYLKEGQLDTAVYRFNLAYLLNPTCAEPYWGLGVISYHRGDLPEAIKLLGKGLSVEPQNAALMVDLATLQLTHFKESKDNQELTQATDLLTKSLVIEPANANAYLKLSLVDFYQEHYDQAWEHLHKCRTLDIATIDITYLAELRAKKEDPQGIFK